MQQLTRIKEHVNAISYELLRRNGISVKFRVKTYHEGMNNKEMYYYTPYSFNSKNQKRYSINLTPRSYVQFDFGTEGENNIFFLSENYKNKLMRKLNPMLTMLLAYDDGEIDIVKVDQSGTHIDKKYPISIMVKLGVNTFQADVIIRPEKLDIGVQITINKMTAIIAMNDFFDLCTKLAGLNYTNMTMLILNYLGHPDDLEYNLVDFRPTKIITNESKELQAPIAGSKSLLTGLASSTISPKNYNRMSW